MTVEQAERLMELCSREGYHWHCRVRWLAVLCCPALHSWRSSGLTAHQEGHHVQVSDASSGTAQSELSQLRAQLQKAKVAAGRSSGQNGGRAKVGTQMNQERCLLLSCRSLVRVQ